jgi:hypothetical protein
MKGNEDLMEGTGLMYSERGPIQLVVNNPERRPRRVHFLAQRLPPAQSVSASGCRHQIG